MKTDLHNWSPRLDPCAYPVLLPHISCIENDMYLGNRIMRKLSGRQADFLRSCDGSRTLLQAATATGIDPSFIAEAALWLVWWTNRTDEVRMEPGKIDRLIFCARPQDCWLGMGGRILREASAVHTLVISCFSPSDVENGSGLFHTPDEMNFACRDEAEMVAKLASIHHTMWNIPEYSRRLYFQLPRQSGPDATGESVRQTMLDTIQQFTPEEIFVPAGMTGYPDARLLLQAALSLMGEGYIQNDLHFYEDAPAILGQRQVDEFLSLFENSYLSPSEYYYDINADHIKKDALIEVFISTLDASQKRQWRQSDERNSLFSRIPGSDFAERFWKIQFGSF